MTGFAPWSRPGEPGPDLLLLVPAGVPYDVPQGSLVLRLGATNSLAVEDALLEVRREQQKLREFRDPAPRASRLSLPIKDRLQ